MREWLDGFGVFFAVTLFFCCTAGRRAQDHGARRGRERQGSGHENNITIGSMPALQSPVPRNHLNCGTVGTVMRGGGIGAILEAFPIPLGSVDILPNAPSSAAFGRAAPTVPTAADPECPTAAEPPPPRANEAAEVAKTRNNAMANFVVAFDMGSSVHYRPPNVKLM